MTLHIHAPDKSQGSNVEAPAKRMFNAPLSLENWEKRELATPDFLMGQWLTTTSRVLIVGPTGLGKTNFGLALAFSIAAGVDFLHWKGGRPRRVLYIDGEMPRRLMKQRLMDASRRADGAKPSGLFVLSREDLDLPPLNSEEGYKFLIEFIEQHGPFDLIIFDNIQALLVGDMTTEEQWAKVLPLVRELSKRSIGQVWFHHTGHDENRSYGSKAREWQMDTVILMKRERTDGEADISFSLNFSKARERTPENRADFALAVVSLNDDHWTSSHIERTSKDTGDAMRVLEALLREDPGPCGDKMAEHKEWRKRIIDGWPNKTSEAKKKAFQRLQDRLLKDGKIRVYGDCVGPAAKGDRGQAGQTTLH